MAGADKPAIQIFLHNCFKLVIPNQQGICKTCLHCRGYISTVQPPPAIMFANVLIICVVDTVARAYNAFMWRIIQENYHHK